MLKSFALLISTCSCLLPAFCAPEPPNPEKVLEEIRQIDKKATQEANESGKNLDRAALKTRIREIALKAIRELDRASIAPDKALPWGRIYATADRIEEAATLYRTAADHLGAQGTEAELSYVRALVLLNRPREVVERFESYPSLDVDGLGFLSTFLLYTFAPKYLEADSSLVLRAYTALVRHLDSSQTPKAENLKIMLTLGKAKAYEQTDPTVGSKMVEELLKAPISNDVLLKEARALKTRLDLINYPAPLLNPDRTLGKYTKESDQAGKVVVYDFFAHWCVPCKEGFPDLAELLATYGSQDLLVVGVTEYYGYYGQESGLSAEAEYEKMQADFLSKYPVVTWPFAFVEKKVSESFGVTSIPQVVIVDRKGKVRKIYIGHTAETKAGIRRTVERLLRES